MDPELELETDLNPDELFWELDPMLGEQAGAGTVPWFNSDYRISALFGFQAGDFNNSQLTDANGDGIPGLNIDIMNDTRADGDNVLIMRLQDANPGTVNGGFVQDIFVLDEAPIDTPPNAYYTTDLGMSASSTIQTAIVLILDDESPSNRINGSNSADTINGTASNDTILLGSGNDSVTAGAGNDIVFGQAGNDTLRGEDGDDMLFGNAGNDSLVGGAGSDTLYGGIGADSLVGGNGNDVYIIDDADDVIIDAVGTGDETVELYNVANYTLTAGIDVLNLRFGAVNGTGNDRNNRLSGNSNDNQLEGLEGNDTLQGGGGSDSLFGGVGDDVLFAEGSSFNLGSDDFDDVNVLVGGDGDDALYGGNGQDSLEGGQGNDTLSGLSGLSLFDDSNADTLVGGTGDDLYIVGEGDVIIDAAGTGIETVLAYTDWTLGAGLDHLILESIAGGEIGTGNDLNNRISGNERNNQLVGLAGNDTLYGVEGDDTLNGGIGNDLLFGGNGDDSLLGGTGTDSLHGGNGNDTYYVDSVNDVVRESFADAAAGVDTVFASVSYSLAPGTLPGQQGYGIENLILTGSADINATGNGLSNTLTGNVGNNILTGGAGSDRLNGYGTAINDQTQFDTLIGGGGADTFVLGSTAGVFYNETGDGYAVISDWSATIDQIEVSSGIGQYRLDQFRNVVGGAGLDTEIIYLPTGDRIGIVQDTLNVQLNRDFIFV